MKDTVLKAFLENQIKEGTALAEQSDILDLVPDPVPTPQRYLAVFNCKGLVKDSPGSAPRVAERFVFAIQFPANYLRKFEPWCVVLMEPLTIWHPNIRSMAVCPGRVFPGMGIEALIYQLYEMVTYHRYSPNDALNWDAAEWVRNQGPDAFPIDRRPLKRLRGETGSGEGGASC